MHVMQRSGDDVVEWRSLWVEELGSRPLDRLEYQGMLQCRDRVALRLQLVGDATQERRVDAIDSRFEELTIGEDGTTARAAAPNWWRRRLPADARWREYPAR